MQGCRQDDKSINILTHYIFLVLARTCNVDGNSMNLSVELPARRSSNVFPARVPVSLHGNSTAVREGEQTAARVPPLKLANARELGTFCPAPWQAIMQPQAISSDVQISASSSGQVIRISPSRFKPVVMPAGR